jgi:hypothetical protein
LRFRHLSCFSMFWQCDRAINRAKFSNHLRRQKALDIAV